MKPLIDPEKLQRLGERTAGLRETTDTLNQRLHEVEDALTQLHLGVSAQVELKKR